MSEPAADKNNEAKTQIGLIYYFGHFVIKYYDDHKNDTSNGFCDYVKKNNPRDIDITGLIDNVNQLKNAVFDTIASVGSMFKKGPKVEKLIDVSTKIDLGVQFGNTYLGEIGINDLVNAYTYGKLGKDYCIKAYEEDQDDHFLQYVMVMKENELALENIMGNSITGVYDVVRKTTDFVLLIKRFMDEKKEEKSE